MPATPRRSGGSSATSVAVTATRPPSLPVKRSTSIATVSPA